MENNYGRLLFLGFVHEQQADRKVERGPRCKEEKSGFKL